jgi:heme-degrading monooxygenase HmoA
MIARIWSARTSDTDNANTYQNLFATDALDHLRKLEGFQGAYLLRRDRNTSTEFVAVTLFESLDAVRGFAGDVYEKANVSQPARKVLDDIDERVRHFTVVVADGVHVSMPS